jgi:hypothetical protein
MEQVILLVKRIQLVPRPLNLVQDRKESNCDYD